MSDIRNTWKGKGSDVSKQSSPMIGCVYTGKKNRGKGQAGAIVGVLVQLHEDQNDAILRDKENFPHCVAFDSLKIIINE
jgi:hypothetical protein